MSARVAILSTNFHPRTCGVGDHSMRLAQELRRRGLQACVVVRAPAEPHPEARDLPLIEVPGLRPSEAARQVEAAVSGWRATDVVVQYVPHMLGATRFGSLAVPRLARRLQAGGVRVTVIGHELYIPCRMRPDLAASSALNRAQLALLLKYAHRFVVTTDSRLQAVRPLARLVGATDRLSMVPIGSSALPVPAKGSSGRFDIGVFSTLAAGKRFDVVLEAFGQVAEGVPGSRLFLIGDLVGQGPMLDRLQARIGGQAWADRVHVTGKLPLSEVASLVASLDVFLFPMEAGATTRSSTLPLPLGSGVPVVAYRGPETGPPFRDGDNVVLTAALTAGEFAAAVLRLRSDPELLSRVGAGGARLYQEELAWPVLGAKLVRVMGLTP